MTYRAGCTFGHALMNGANGRREEREYLLETMCSLLFQISYEAAFKNICAQQKAEWDSMMLDDASEAEPASMTGP